MTSPTALSLSIILMACACLLECKHSNENLHILPDEQAELDSLVTIFFMEATARGRDVSAWRKTVEITFGRMRNHHAGSCRPNSHPKLVTIDHFFWKTSDSQKREQLVFHELAHCLLQRAHVSDTFKFGECKSWMRAVDSDCLINLHNKTWRKYYLDELFMQHPIALPSWYPENETTVDPAHYQKYATISLTPSSHQLDSLLANETRDWILSVSSPPYDSTNKPTFLALTVDNLVFEQNNYNIDRNVISTAGIINRIPEKGIFRQNHGHNSFSMSLQRRNDCVYLFLDGILRYCLPLDKGHVKIAGFGSPAGKYTIEAYVMP